MKSKTFWIAILVTITVIGLLTLPISGKSAEKVQWEYYTDSPSSAIGHLSVERLNKLGLEGWELVDVAVVEGGGGPQYIFKRKK